MPNQRVTTSRHVPSRRYLAALCCVWVALGAAAASAQQLSSFPLSDVVKGQAAQLAGVDSNPAALTAFATSIGPAVGLRDAAGTVGAKNIPPKMAKELGVAELSSSAQRLIAALAAWQLAGAVLEAVEPGAKTALSSVAAPSGAREEWLTANGPWNALPELLRLLKDGERAPQQDLSLAAHRLALEASQRAAAHWWDLHGWKDRVRHARGRARLCGTWQWVVHNHQNHQEQKTSMLFLPPGMEKPGVPVPAEMVVLGDSVYLRWEMDGRVQEDSLLFIKDGTRIEGSFVNNLGGWGSITGKRTAGCQP
jgi:hypothetical protein